MPGYGTYQRSPGRYGSALKGRGFAVDIECAQSNARSLDMDEVGGEHEARLAMLDNGPVTVCDHCYHRKPDPTCRERGMAQRTVTVCCKCGRQVPR